MRAWSVGVLTVALLAAVVACAGKSGATHGSLTPYLYPETIQISPNPADPDTDVTFLVGWKDIDGDIKQGTIRVRLVDDFDESSTISIKNLQFRGDTAGVLTFAVTIHDGDQGTYYVTAVDAAGRVSNEVDQYLLVNAPHPGADDDATVDDDTMVDDDTVVDDDTTLN